MKYTKTIEVEAKIGAETQLAIQAFAKVQRLEKRLERAEKEANGWLVDEDTKERIIKLYQDN